MGFTIEETAFLLDHFRSGVKQTLHSRIILELLLAYNFNETLSKYVF
jgi:hypothetical protein